MSPFCQAERRTYQLLQPLLHSKLASKHMHCSMVGSQTCLLDEQPVQAISASVQSTLVYAVCSRSPSFACQQLPCKRSTPRPGHSSSNELAYTESLTVVLQRAVSPGVALIY